MPQHDPSDARGDGGDGRDGSRSNGSGGAAASDTWAEVIAGAMCGQNVFSRCLMQSGLAASAAADGDRENDADADPDAYAGGGGRRRAQLEKLRCVVETQCATEHGAAQFVRDFEDFTFEDKPFRMALAPCVSHASAAGAYAFISVYKVLLRVAAIQTRLISYVLERVPEYLEEQPSQRSRAMGVGGHGDAALVDDIPRLILRQFTWQEALIEPAHFVHKALELLDVAPEGYQREIILSLPKMLDDGFHKNVIASLQDLLQRRPRLLPSILTTMGELQISEETLELLQSTLAPRMRSADIADVPAILTFLLETASPEQAVPMITAVREHLDLTEPSLSASHLASASAAASLLSTIGLIHDTLRLCLSMKTPLAIEWLKQMAAAPPVRSLDWLVMLILLETMPQRVYPVVFHVAKTASAPAATAAFTLLVERQPQLVQRHFPRYLAMVQDMILKADTTPRVMATVTAMLLSAFRHLDLHEQQEIMALLVQNMAPQPPRHGAMILDAMAQLADAMPAAFARFALFVRSLLDNAPAMHPDNARTLHQLLAMIARHGYDGDDDGHLGVQVMYVRKQLMQLSIEHIEQGIMNGLALVGAFAAVDPGRRDPSVAVTADTFADLIQRDRWLDQARQVFDHLLNAAQRRGVALLILIRETYLMIPQLHRAFVYYIAEQLPNPLMDHHFIDDAAVLTAPDALACLDVPPGNELGGFHLRDALSPSQDAPVISILPTVLRYHAPRASTGERDEEDPLAAVARHRSFADLLAPTFALWQACFSHLDGSLRQIDAILQYGVVLYPPDLVTPARFMDLSVDAQDAVCTSLFAHMNWLRVCLNVYTAAATAATAASGPTAVTAAVLAPEIRADLAARLQTLCAQTCVLQRLMPLTAWRPFAHLEAAQTEQTRLAQLLGVKTAAGAGAAAGRGSSSRAPRSAGQRRATAGGSRWHHVATSVVPLSLTTLVLMPAVGTDDLTPDMWEALQFLLDSVAQTCATRLAASARHAAAASPPPTVGAGAAASPRLSAAASATAPASPLPSSLGGPSARSRGPASAAVRRDTPTGSWYTWMAADEDATTVVERLCPHLPAFIACLDQLLPSLPAGSACEATPRFRVVRDLLQIVTSVMTWGGWHDAAQASLQLAWTRPWAEATADSASPPRRTRDPAADDADAVAAALPPLRRNAMQYVAHLVEETRDPSLAAALVAILQAWLRLAASPDTSEKLCVSRAAGRVLARDSAGDGDPTPDVTLTPVQLRDLLQLHIGLHPNPVALVHTYLTTALRPFAERGDASASRYLTPATFPVFYRVCFEQLVASVVRLRQHAAALDAFEADAGDIAVTQGHTHPVLKCIRYQTATYYELVKLICHQPSSDLAFLSLSYGIKFLRGAIQQMLPLIAEYLLQFPSSIGRRFTPLQKGARLLLALCEERQFVKLPRIRRLIPLLRSQYGVFVGHVKDMLHQLGQSRAVSIRPLRHRNLRGEHVDSQLDPDSDTAPSPDEVAAHADMDADADADADVAEAPAPARSKRKRSRRPAADAGAADVIAAARPMADGAVQTDTDDPSAEPSRKKVTAAAGAAAARRRARKGKAPLRAIDDAAAVRVSPSPPKPSVAAMLREPSADVDDEDENEPDTAHGGEPTVIDLALSEDDDGEAAPEAAADVAPARRRPSLRRPRTPAAASRTRSRYIISQTGSDDDSAQEAHEADEDLLGGRQHEGDDDGHSDPAMDDEDAGTTDLASDLLAASARQAPSARRGVAVAASSASSKRRSRGASRRAPRGVHRFLDTIADASEDDDDDDDETRMDETPGSLNDFIVNDSDAGTESGDGSTVQDVDDIGDASDDDADDADDDDHDHDDDDDDDDDESIMAG
ncbi:hypothetical protein CXG81DRAFT_26765 [Caulochytrium protostelioides]|uniref:Uncharacterized protein n=1 Tax=Caulochytrium protostelioides TaxID=1555241 RepID=A0A4P9X5V3_9FUNG|nr:hypothetical protein CXG81DRAFT_26765 [Caulochytrium protostelioides]|eukprot:RKP00536.1 hypothetical protein CXG81DRAFT_26765 [Caulochytrium protostelioides]